jgi:hypothetical protein
MIAFSDPSFWEGVNWLYVRALFAVKPHRMKFTLSWLFAGPMTRASLPATTPTKPITQGGDGNDLTLTVVP